MCRSREDKKGCDNAHRSEWRILEQAPGSVMHGTVDCHRDEVDRKSKQDVI
jgi:hypothetical protein